MSTRLDNAKRKLAQMKPELDRKLESGSSPSLPAKLIQKAEDAVNNAGMMEAIMEERFSTASSRGTPWPTDSASTSKEKSKRGESSVPLQASGALKTNAISAVAGTFKFGPIVWDISKVGLRYAKMVNKKRPFFSAPSSEELSDAVALAGQELLKGIQNELG